jgi:hypothetical protein
MFSAIDLQSGSVITVIQEQACNMKEYAQSQKTCDLLLPSAGPNDGNTGKQLLFSGETVAKDVSKLLIRHDDRDNAVLLGTTKLDSYKLQVNPSSKNDVLDLIATTTIPSGGTYRDTMGIDRPNTIDRRVKAKAVVVTNGKGDGDGGAAPGVTTRTSILSIWLSAPLDEWQKPVMGTKLANIWDSVKYVE